MMLTDVGFVDPPRVGEENLGKETEGGEGGIAAAWEEERRSSCTVACHHAMRDRSEQLKF